MTSTNKFFSAFSIVLSVFFFSFSANAAATLETDGGPRHIIHTYAEVKVVQQSQEALTVVVRNESGEVVAETVTNDLQTPISTDGWEEGHYTVEVHGTNNNDSEEFCFMKN